MFYHSFTNKHNLKNTATWLSLVIMLVTFLSLLFSDFQPKQKLISLKIDIKNKVNICLPEDENLNKN